MTLKRYKFYCYFVKIGLYNEKELINSLITIISLGLLKIFNIHYTGMQSEIDQ